jgi:hypothetical protein
MNGATNGAKGTMSESGWSNSEIFKEYLKSHFLPYVRPVNSQQPVLLIYDGHSSHKTPDVIRWAKDQHIILFVLPAHASHILQPLDVCIFGPFKRHYYAECSSYMYENIGQTITRFDMCSIACKAYAKAMSPMNIMSGFKKTGIFPFEPTVVPSDKFFPCETFREEKPVEKVKAIKSGREAVEEFLRMKEDKMHGKGDASGLEEPAPKSCSKKRKFSSRPNASGVAITGDTYLQELETLEKRQEEAIPRNAGTKPIHVAHKQASPKPSCSGLHLKKVSVTQISTDSDIDSTSDDDDDDDDDECCCVCNRRSPPNTDKFPQLKIINWASCDKCQHWVHLAYCTMVRVVRRHSSFLCPHCEN